MLIRYPGSKDKAAPDLLALAPADFTEYRDAFAGSAAMLWEVPTDVRRWVNDIDPNIYTFLTALRDDPTLPERIADLHERFSHASQEDISRQFYLSKYHWGARRCPLAYIFLSRYAYGQMVTDERQDYGSLGVHNQRNGIRPVSADRVEAARRIMQGVRITQWKYQRVLEAPGKNVFIFADPPYLLDHHSAPIYSHEFTVQQHRQFAKDVLKCKHKVMVTIGHCGLSHEIYVESGRFNYFFRKCRYSSVLRDEQPEIYELVALNYSS